MLLLLIRRRAVRLLLLLGRGLLLMVLRVALGLLVLPSLIVPRRARVEPAPTIVPVLAGVPSRGRGVLPVAPAPPAVLVLPRGGLVVSTSVVSLGSSPGGVISG